MKVIINLEQFRINNSKVFVGSDNGRNIRIKSKIDNFIKSNKIIEIVVPKDIMSINPSFLEEFLFNIVKNLGKESFNKRVNFKVENLRYDIKPDVIEAVDRILRR